MVDPVMDVLLEGHSPVRCDLCFSEQPVAELMPITAALVCRDYNACYERRRKPRKESR